MSEGLQVVEDGAGAPPPGAPSSRSSWFMALAGFVVGLGLGVLVVQPGVQDSGEAGLTSPTIPETTTTSTSVVAPEALGAAAVIEGFPDAIVAVARTSGSALDHVLWPVSGEVTVRPMTGGADVILDVGSQFIAVSEEVPGSDGRLLSMGRFNTMRAVASDALSYAWHDSTIGALSYTARRGESTVLYSVRADLLSVPVAEIPYSDATLIAWGDWGWALQQTSDEILLLNPDGEMKDIESGVGLASHPTGWVLVAEGDAMKLVSAGGGVRGIGPSPDVGNIRGARFAPDASRVAVAGDSGVAVVNLETGEALDFATLPVSSLAWSSDSRFVLAPTASGVAVFDLEQPARTRAVLREHWMLVVGTVPLRSS